MKKVKYNSKHQSTTLKALGLEEQDFRAAVLAGEIARNNASMLHPKMFPGYAAFAERVKVIRERLMPEPRNWTPLNEKGLELVVSADGKTGILISTGDTGTGDPLKLVKSKYPKGYATEQIVKKNAQASFADDVLGVMVRPKDVSLPPGRTYWYLLVYPGTTEIKYELAKPHELDNENRLSGWSERIFFDPIIAGQDFSIAPETQNIGSDTKDEEFVVSVTKKA